jgi:anaerobic selenocysteine-containing dehydrogenase
VDVPSVERSPHEVLGRDTERFSFWPARLLRDAAQLGGAPVGGEALYTGANGATTEGRPENEAAGAFPLRLLLFDTNSLWAGRTALTPLMLEMAGFREDIAWDSWVEIHPETARRSGIKEGDRVRLESSAGSLVTRARLADVIPPDAVAMPRGLGHRHFGRFASGAGTNPVALVSPSQDLWTGVAVLGTRVRLAPVRT